MIQILHDPTLPAVAVLVLDEEGGVIVVNPREIEQLDLEQCRGLFNDLLAEATERPVSRPCQVAV